MMDVTLFVTDAVMLPVESFDWGTLKWLCNDRLLPSCQQTLGLCQIRPGYVNPRHFHPNCEEVLHLLSGQGRHSLGDDCVDLSAGMTIRIPAGVLHNLENTGSETLVCLIAFDSGVRETVFVEK